MENNLSHRGCIIFLTYENFQQSFFLFRNRLPVTRWKHGMEQRLGTYRDGDDTTFASHLISPQSLLVPSCFSHMYNKAVQLFLLNTTASFLQFNLLFNCKRNQQNNFLSSIFKLQRQKKKMIQLPISIVDHVLARI